MHIEIATLVCSKDVRAEFLCEKMRVSLSFFIKNQSTIRDFYNLIYLHVEFDKCENTKLRPAYPLKRSWVVDKPSLALPCIQESQWLVELTESVFHIWV